MAELTVPESAFEEGTLDKDYHERLLNSLGVYATAANILPQYVWTKLSEYCRQEDAPWVRSIKKSEDSGLVYIGRPKHAPIEDVMMAIAGALLRNYIDAKVMTLQAVIDHLDAGTMPTPTVLLIPNFFLSANKGGKVATWEVSTLLGLLYTRMTAGQKTVLFVSDIKEMEKEYGITFNDHILNHYTIVNN